MIGSSSATTPPIWFICPAANANEPPNLADIRRAKCLLLGVKRICRLRCTMSAYDPKRTSAPHAHHSFKMLVSAPRKNLHAFAEEINA